LCNHTVKPIILRKLQKICIQLQIDDNLTQLSNARIIPLLYTNNNLEDRIHKPYNKNKIICNLTNPYKIHGNNWIEPIFFNVYTPFHILGIQVIFTPYTITNREPCVTISDSKNKIFRLYCSYVNDCIYINRVEIEIYDDLSKYSIDWKLLFIFTVFALNGHIFIPLYVLLSYKIVEMTTEYCTEDLFYERRYIDW